MKELKECSPWLPPLSTPGGHPRTWPLGAALCGRETPVPPGAVRGTPHTPVAWDTEGSFSSRREDIYKNSRMGADFERRVEIPGILFDCVLLAKILCNREHAAVSGYSCTEMALGEVPSPVALCPSLAGPTVAVGGQQVWRRRWLRQNAVSLGNGASL